MLCPTHRVDDGADFLHVAIFADRGKQIDRLQVLILGDTGDPLYDFWGVARILLLQQLEDTPRMLKGQVVSDFGGQGGRWRHSSDLPRHRFRSVTGRTSLAALPT